LTTTPPDGPPLVTGTQPSSVDHPLPVGGELPSPSSSPAAIRGQDDGGTGDEDAFTAVGNETAPPNEDQAGTSGTQDLSEAGEAPLEETAATTHEGGLPRVRVPRRLDAYPALERVPALGEPGRQREIISVLSPVAVGVPDTLLDFLTVDPFEVRACSTRGYSHRYSGAPRQDAYCVAYNEDWLVVAVADGVSQGVQSHVAAETAARAACKLVLDQAESLASLDWAALCGRLSRRIIDEAAYRRIVPLPDEASTTEQVMAVRGAMSTTLVVAAIRRSADAGGRFDGHLAIIAGDSGAYVIDDDGMRAIAGGKEANPGSPISSSAVDPLPGASSPDVQPLVLNARQGLVLVTDGIGDAVGAGTGEVGEQLARRWCTPPPISAFFEDVNFLRRSYDDDRTVVGVWPLPESMETR
jgi:hypothetical protein